MKRRHFISFVFVLILCIGMIGCGKEKKTTASDKFQSDYMEIGVGTTVEKGYFGVINGLLYYVDFETMNAVPICNKPDCRHISWMEDRNTKCNAANTDIWNLFPYKGKLYGFRSLADGGSELVVSDLDGSNWKSKGMFIKAEESFHEGVVVKDQMFYLKDVALREEEAAEPELETVMCMLDLDTMKSREICRERGTFSIQFLGGTKDYQIYSVKGEDGVTCYQFDYKKEVSKEISLYDIPGRIIGADETGFYYNSGIDYPSAVYRYHFETGENEVFVSKEEAKAAYGKDVFSLSLWDVREEGILFKIWYGEDQRLFLKEADSGKLRQLSLSEELLKEDFVLNGMLFKNEEGLGFEYTQYLDMDQINWYGYISWEDLLSDENNVKVLIEPRMTSRGYYKFYMTDQQGKMTEEKVEYFNEERKRFEEIYSMTPENSDLTAVEIVQKQEENKYAHEGFSEAYSQVMYIMSNNQGKGVNEQELVYEKGYQLLFGDKAVKERLIGILLCVIAAVYSASGVLGTEYDLKVMNLLRSTKRGRKELFLKKLGVSFGITAVIFVLVKIPAILKVVGEYPLECWGAKVRSMMFAGQSVINCSIFGYVLMLMIMQLVTLFVIVFSTMALSVVLKDSTMTMILSLLLFGGPLLIEWGGVPIVHYLSLNSLLDGHQILQGNWLVLISEIVIFWGALSFAAGYVLYRAYENRR